MIHSYSANFKKQPQPITQIIYLVQADGTEEHSASQWLWKGLGGGRKSEPFQGKGSHCRTVRPRLRAQQCYSNSRWTKGLRESTKCPRPPLGTGRGRGQGPQGRHRDSGCEHGSVFCGRAGAAREGVPVPRVSCCLPCQGIWEGAGLGRCV